MATRPNPFNPETEIGFALPEPAAVRLSVLDVLGREVAVLENRNLTAGYKSVRWNGRSSRGDQVSSGMYFYRLRAIGVSGKSFVETRKMLMTK
ncbi:MAG: T9SS type A sorting domain-containing protein [Ignavibacteriae bacterium]|nr:T9SS type A sorting domain-containing protein [Ignavibacteriota bacterium]